MSIDTSFIGFENQSELISPIQSASASPRRSLFGSRFNLEDSCTPKKLSSVFLRGSPSVSRFNLDSDVSTEGSFQSGSSRKRRISDASYPVFQPSLHLKYDLDDEFSSESSSNSDDHGLISSAVSSAASLSVSGSDRDQIEDLSSQSSDDGLLELVSSGNSLEIISLETSGEINAAILLSDGITRNVKIKSLGAGDEHRVFELLGSYSFTLPANLLNVGVEVIEINEATPLVIRMPALRKDDNLHRILKINGSPEEKLAAQARFNRDEMKKCNLTSIQDHAAIQYCLSNKELCETFGLSMPTVYNMPNPKAGKAAFMLVDLIKGPKFNVDNWDTCPLVKKALQVVKRLLDHEVHFNKELVGDLSPRNAMFGNDGKLYYFDFSLPIEFTLIQRIRNWSYGHEKIARYLIEGWESLGNNGIICKQLITNELLNTQKDCSESSFFDVLKPLVKSELEPYQRLYKE